MVMRVSILVVIYMVCAVSPELIHFISLSGALFNSTLGFLIPVVLHTRYFRDKKTLSPAQTFLNLAVVVIGGGMSAVAVVDSSLRLLKLKK